MRQTMKQFLFAAALVLSGALVGPVATAAATDASIKALISGHESKIVADEGRLLTAIGEFKKSANPTAVEAADKVVISDLRTLASKLSKLRASTVPVKLGKSKFDKGLLTIAIAYSKLEKVFAEQAHAPSAALAESKKVLKAVKKGQRQLQAGVKLLNS